MKPFASMFSRARTLRAGRLPGMVLLVVAALGSVGVIAREQRAGEDSARSMMRFSVDLGAAAVMGPYGTVAISPDGTRIVYPVRQDNGIQVLATRLLNQTDNILLPGTQNGSGAFFSPDGKWVGFYGRGRLRKVPVSGGPDSDVCWSYLRGGDWTKDGTIVFANFEGGLWRVPETGCDGGRLAQQLTTVEAGGTHRWPQVLPGGKAVLFTASRATGSYAEATLKVVFLETLESRELGIRGAFGRYVPSSADGTGHLLYLSGNQLMGVAFDPVRLRTLGDPVPLPLDPVVNPEKFTQLSFSETGTLAYISLATIPRWTIRWMDSSGKTEPLNPEPAMYYDPAVAPDGTPRMAFAANYGKGSDVYVFDWQRKTLLPLTRDGETKLSPVWAPDGRHILYSSSGSIRWVRADGSAESETLLRSNAVVRVLSIAPDGRHLAYNTLSQERQADILTIALDMSDPDHPKAGTPTPFLDTTADERGPSFSPDGRWLAYAAAGQIFVRPFPAGDPAVQVSVQGGSNPQWSGTGRELFFENGARIMMAEYAIEGGTFKLAQEPRPWSEQQIYSVPGYDWNFSPHGDGKRFGFFTQPLRRDGNMTLHAVFLLNYFDELRRTVPRK